RNLGRSVLAVVTVDHRHQKTRCSPQTERRFRPTNRDEFVSGARREGFVEGHRVWARGEHFPSIHRSCAAKKTGADSTTKNWLDSSTMRSFRAVGSSRNGAPANRERARPNVNPSRRVIFRMPM